MKEGSSDAKNKTWQGTFLGRPGVPKEVLDIHISLLSGWAGPGQPSVMGVSIIHWSTDLTLPQWSVGKPLFQLLKWTPEEIGPV